MEKVLRFLVYRHHRRLLLRKLKKVRLLRLGVPSLGTQPNWKYILITQSLLERLLSELQIFYCVEEETGN